MNPRGVVVFLCALVIGLTGWGMSQRQRVPIEPPPPVTRSFSIPADVGPMEIEWTHPSGGRFKITITDSRWVIESQKSRFGGMNCVSDLGAK